MRLKYVTITGADEAVTAEQLGALTDKYPLVEWAILFSPNKQGSSRYPGKTWTDRLQAYANERDSLSIAAHLCGGWTRFFIQGNFAFSEEKFDYERMQVNMTDDAFMSLDFQKLLNTYCESVHEPDRCNAIILQTKRAFQRHEWLAIINKSQPKLKFQMLYDVSGGKGVQPKTWHPPVDGVTCGYAGGIGPDNVVDILKKIGDVAGDTPFWIDMESGVRTNDKFDIVKVESVLEQVHNYLS